MFGPSPKPLPKIGSKAAKGLCRIDGDKPSESNWFEGRQCKVMSGNGILGSNMGGLVSTLSDNALFFTMLLNGGVLNGRRILQEATMQEWGFSNLLPLPGSRGKIRRTGSGWTGWSALGERGMKRWKRDNEPNMDDYEDGEIAMGGCANTYWSINPVRDTVTLWFSQALDSDAWPGDYWTKKGIRKANACNFTVAARAVAPRNAAAAALRRKRLSSSSEAVPAAKRSAKDVDSPLKQSPSKRARLGGA